MDKHATAERDAPRSPDARASSFCDEAFELLWRAREDHVSATQFADAKVGAAFLAASTATGWASAAFAGAGSLQGFPRFVAAALLLTTFAGFLATMAFAVQTIRPHRARDLVSGRREEVWRGLVSDLAAARGPREEAPTQPALVYFGDVAEYPSDEAFRADLSHADADELARQLCQDVWRSAALCARKYEWVRRSVAWAAFTGLGSMLTLLALALARG
jgi:hypothetical protein